MIFLKWFFHRGSFLYTKIVEMIHELTGGPPEYPVVSVFEDEEEEENEEATDPNRSGSKKYKKRHQDPWRK